MIRHEDLIEELLFDIIAKITWIRSLLDREDE
jgi:hypothetical protein